MHLAPETQNRPFRDREPAPPCPGIRSQKDTGIDDPTFRLQPVAKRTARIADDASPQADQEDLTAPTGYNLLPCDLSRVGRAGTVKPTNRGAREVPEHNVTTMKAKDTAPAPGRRATEKPQTWNTQNAKARSRPGLKRAIRQKTRPPDVRRSPTRL